MSGNHFASPIAEDEIRTLAGAGIDALTRELAARVFSTTADEHVDEQGRLARGSPNPAGGFEPDASGDDHALLRLRVLAYLARAVEECASEEAARAANAGAGYPELGAAWNMTRQGARRRWPGLVFTATPTTRPIPPHDRSDPMNATRAYDVLLVEDDPADAMLIEEALREHGMARRITRVEDGVAALQHLRDRDLPRPDLIVLDLNMPRMNGRELLAVLKDDPELLSIPVVVLTTSASPEDVASAYERHANAYVTKPVNLDDFLRTVRSIDAFFLDTAVIPSKD
ncbi:response regulator [Embleya sp. NPDC050493]|uniref:response regulator n=1 Tax=Embleya sp. NPDC050493 TaxID=3363989 RepID=UPI0037B1CCF8